MYVFFYIADTAILLKYRFTEIYTLVFSTSIIMGPYSPPQSTISRRVLSKVMVIEGEYAELLIIRSQ